jgi:cell division septation protein DedD
MRRLSQKKIKKGGYPSFVEVFGKNKNLYAIYVGPFLSKEEISSNIEDIKEVSQSSQGEVTRWKL